MNTPLRVLIIDDSPLDTELILRELRKSFEPEHVRVDTPLAMLEALKSRSWDIIISDYVMPAFSGIDAINALRDSGIDVPLIIVSGNVGEELAVETMRAGANDYLIKNNLTRLVPAIRRELQDAAVRSARKEAELRSLKLSESIALASLCFLETGSINRMAQVLVDSCAALTSSAFGCLYDLLPGGDARVLAVFTSIENNDYTSHFERLVDKYGYYHVPHCDCLLFMPILKGITLLANEPTIPARQCCTEQLNLPLVTSFLGIPLKIGSRMVGAICLANKPEGFTEIEQKELDTFAQTAALAIHSARAELDHKLAMEQLRQAQKMEAIGQLAGGIAHDFNNLLTVINGYSTLLLNGMDENDPYRGDIEYILQAGERAADLTHQLLAFSRRQILEPKTLRINHLVINLQKMLQRLIRENIALETSLDEHAGVIKADPGQVEQIIMNLVVNARDALETGGIITINTANIDFDDSFVRENRGAVKGKYVMLGVSDNGIGMAEEIRKKIFEPFFTTKAQGRGTGLGLATVYGIVKQSGGYIQVISEPGKGSSFRVFLPRVEEAETIQDTQTWKHKAPRGYETILIVEDEEGVLNLAARALAEVGYNVLEASSVTAACEIFEKDVNLIKLLLTDVVMPVKSGPELARELKEKNPGLKIIFMSGYTDTPFPPADLAEEDVAFIMKPFTPSMLAGKVRELLGS